MRDKLIVLAQREPEERHEVGRDRPTVPPHLVGVQLLVSVPHLLWRKEIRRGLDRFGQLLYFSQRNPAAVWAGVERLERDELVVLLGDEVPEGLHHFVCLLAIDRPGEKHSVLPL